MSKIRWVNCAFLRSQDLQFSQNIYPLQLDLPNARPKRLKRFKIYLVRVCGQSTLKFMSAPVVYRGTNCKT